MRYTHDPDRELALPVKEKGKRVRKGKNKA